MENFNPFDPERCVLDASQINYAEKPLIYSCSGCSSAAQMANHLAVQMDRGGEAEMSCIAGLGGDVKPLVRTALQAVESGRPIVMIDGCPLKCGLHILARHAIRPDLHWDLSKRNVRKEKHVDFDPLEAEPSGARTKRSHSLLETSNALRATALLP